MGAGTPLDIVRNPPRQLMGGPPAILLVCPPPLGRLDRLTRTFEGGEAKSRSLAEPFKRVAELRDCHFLDAGEHIVTSDGQAGGDGVHLDADQRKILGQAVAEKVRGIIGAG